MKKLLYEKPGFLPVLHELVRSVQAFERYSGQHIRLLGLTPPQFDVLVTLGNTEGMTFSELAQNTLMTKGTLTGVVDRLEEKALAKRCLHALDGRKVVVALTEAGAAEFGRVFPLHLAHLGKAFARINADALRQTERDARFVRIAFEEESRAQARAAKIARALNPSPSTTPPP